MTSIADLLLKMTGHSDPTKALLAQALGHGGAPPGTAPGGAVPGGSTPGAGVPTQGYAPGGSTGQPPRSPAYDSPPDLLQLYSELSDYQSRQKRIDSGMGLLATGIVQPRNADAVSRMFSDGGNQPDPLSLVMQLQNFKAAQDEKARAQAKQQRLIDMAPAIAKQYGISEETAATLAENGELDQFILEAAKPDNKVVTDDSTGTSRVINMKTGEVVKDLGGSLKPTSDEQEFMDAKARGEIPADTTLQDWQDHQANARRPSTTVNVDTKAASAFAGALDKNITDTMATLPDSATSIAAVQQGRAALDKGVIAGSIASPATVEGRKLFAGIFGLKDEAANNSDEFVDAMKTQVLPKLKTLYPASDTDVKYLEGMTAATLTQHPEVLNRIIDKIEIGERKKIIDTNAKAQKRINAEPDPVAKAQMQAAFEAQRVDPPAYDDVYMSHIDPDDAEKLKKEPTPDNIKEFDKLYGPGVAEQLLGAK